MGRERNLNIKPRSFAGGACNRTSPPGCPHPLPDVGQAGPGCLFHPGFFRHSHAGAIVPDLYKKIDIAIIKFHRNDCRLRMPDEKELNSTMLTMNWEKKPWFT